MSKIIPHTIAARRRLSLILICLYEELGCSKWKKTSACLNLVLPRSQAKIARRGGRYYDPQLVKRSSE